MSAAKPYLLICLFGMPAQVHLEEKAVSLVVINGFHPLFSHFLTKKSCL